MKALLSAVVLVLCLNVQGFSQEQNVIERSKAYQALITDAAEKHGVDRNLIWTVAYLESRFRPEVVSPKGAIGLMQFLPGTAARYGVSDPRDPRQSIDAGTRYLRDLLRQFDGRVDLVLAAYNAGETAVIAFRDGRSVTLTNGKVINPAGRKTSGVPPYSETMSYVVNGIAILNSLSESNSSKADTSTDDESKEPLPDLKTLKERSLSIFGRARTSKQSSNPRTRSIVF